MSDSGDLVIDLWTAWAQARGIDPGELSAFVHGRRTSDVVARFAPDADPHVEAVRIETDFADDFGDQMDSIAPVCDLYATLAPGRRAVVTSATRAGAQARMKGLGLELEVLIGAEDVEQGKPSPEGYLAGARALGLEPAACAVLEDSPAGIAAGRAAGATVIAITTTHPAGDLAEADHVVDPGALEALAGELLG